MLDLFDELRDVIARLDEDGVPYALCGGLAMAVHGFPRATVDIDVLANDFGRVEAGQVLSLDVLLVTPEIEAAWNTRQAMTWAFGNIWVVSPQGLVALKSLRGSGRDQDDIKQLRGELE